MMAKMMQPKVQTKMQARKKAKMTQSQKARKRN